MRLTRSGDCSLHFTRGFLWMSRRLDDRRSKETELTKTLAFLSEALGSG